MHNIRILSLLTLLTLPCLLLSCSEEDEITGPPPLESCQPEPGEGPIVTRTLELNAFEKVGMNVEGQVFIRQAATQQVTVTGHSNVLDALNQQIQGNAWSIDFGNLCFEDFELTINIDLPDLSAASIAGSGDIEISAFENQGPLSLSVSGSGDLTTQAFTGTPDVSSSVSGSGSIAILDNFPNAGRASVSIAGSGDYFGFSFTTLDLSVSIAGSGTAEVAALESLTVTITGSGDVLYVGQPVITSNITGTGQLIDAN